MKVEIPECFEKLQVGDVIKKGDRVNSGHGWFYTSRAGFTVGGNLIYIRRIKKGAK